MQRTKGLCLLTAMIGLAGLVSCSEQKEDVTQAINKAGAVETSVTVQHADSTHDIVLTTNKIWVNQAEYKTVIHQDTVPALGMMETEGENADGDTKKLSVPKDYEIYITVK